MILPLALPGILAGSIFVFSLSMGDFVAPTLVGGAEKVLGGAIKDYAGGGSTTNLPFAAALASLTLIDAGRLPGDLAPQRRDGEPLMDGMSNSRAEKIVFGAARRRWCCCSCTCRWC